MCDHRRMVTRAGEISKEWYHNNKDYHALRARKYLLERKAWLQAQKDRPCADCGIKYPPYVMDFDHREGEIKLFSPAQCGNPRIVPMSKAIAELAKCDVVCANCHRERTHQRGYTNPKDDHADMAVWTTRTPSRPRKQQGLLAPPQ